MDNSYGLAELHEQLLTIMDDIDRVCRKHDIKYTISDGTLLGAIRHKGFIPWDDDMDVRMVREEFEKFKPIYEKEKKENFIIGHPCNPATYSVINTEFVMPGIKQVGNSIVNPWVSIFVMDRVPVSEKASRRKATKMRILSGMMGKPPQYPFFSKKSQRMWSITSFLGGIIGRKNARKWFEKSCVAHKDSEAPFFSSYSFNSKGTYKRYPEEWFSEVEDMQFEDRVYKGIVRYDEFLTFTYGDYMTPPPVEKRDVKHVARSE